MRNCFDSFDLKYANTNRVVDYDEVDKMVREEFHLVGSENDFGHYCFPETEGPWREKTMSWIRLLHCIVRYSNIGYGYRNTYEILGAMEELRHGIDSIGVHPNFPLSTVPFVARLLDFLKSKGLYVYVQYDDSEDRDLYENLPHTEKLRFLKTDSGWFECDETGRLMNFYPDLMHNSASKITANRWNSYSLIRLNHFIIPEGVTDFSMNFLREGWASDHIVYPKSFEKEHKEINLMKWMMEWEEIKQTGDIFKVKECLEKKECHDEYQDQEMTVVYRELRQKLLEEMKKDPVKFSITDVKKYVKAGIFTEEELVAEKIISPIMDVIHLPGMEQFSTQNHELNEGTDVYFFG